MCIVRHKSVFTVAAENCMLERFATVAIVEYGIAGRKLAGIIVKINVRPVGFENMSRSVCSFESIEKISYRALHNIDSAGLQAVGNKSCTKFNSVIPVFLGIIKCRLRVIINGARICACERKRRHNHCEGYKYGYNSFHVPSSEIFLTLVFKQRFNYNNKLQSCQ